MCYTEKNKAEKGGIRESKTWWIEIAVLNGEVGEPVKVGVI